NAVKFQFMIDLGVARDSGYVPFQVKRWPQWRQFSDGTAATANQISTRLRRHVKNEIADLRAHTALTHDSEFIQEHEAAVYRCRIAKASNFISLRDGIQIHRHPLFGQIAKDFLPG